MKLSVIGSIKLDSRWRRKLFVYNLESLKPISGLLSWRVNIVGKFAKFASEKIRESYPSAKATIDDSSSYYQITKDQLEKSQSDIILFWEEDNWFFCPNDNLFSYLLSEFEGSEAEVLTISHLVTSWETKALLPLVKSNFLYKEYAVDRDSQKNIWEKHPNAYLTGITAIYKRKLALDILEFNKDLLISQKNARYFETDRKRGEAFLEKRSFIEMVPAFQVFREVSRFQNVERNISIRKAKQVLRLRGQRFI